VGTFTDALSEFGQRVQSLRFSASAGTNINSVNFDRDIHEPKRLSGSGLKQPALIVKHRSGDL